MALLRAAAVGGNRLEALTSLTFVDLLPFIAVGFAAQIIDGALGKAFVLAYLTAIGLFLIWRGLRYPPHHKPPKIIEPLGLVGGFLDAAGGGGWGPVVKIGRASFRER